MLKWDDKIENIIHREYNKWYSTDPKKSKESHKRFPPRACSKVALN